MRTWILLAGTALVVPNCSGDDGGEPGGGDGSGDVGADAGDGGPADARGGDAGDAGSVDSKRLLLRPTQNHRKI